MTNTNKILVTMLIALLSTGIYAQVGINTKDPKATLDIVANTVSPTANGILVPRLTAKQVKAMETKVGADQNALLVYVTATFTTTPTTAKYSEITAVGYYYYDAPNDKWKKLSGGSKPTTYTAGAGIEIGGGTISATGLERITEGGSTGWRLIGWNPNNYGNIGANAVDLSNQTTTSTTTGATGSWSTAMGFVTTASGRVSTAMGVRTTASGNYSTAMGVRTTASGNYSTAMGHSTTAPYFSSTALGMYNATPTNALLMVGNGYTTSGPPIYQNALTVYNTGDIEAKGIYDANGSTATKVVVVDTNGKLQSIPKSSLGGNYTAGAGIEISGGVVSATGLERVTENGKTGWRLIGSDPHTRGDIGENAVDLSYQIRPHRGAKGKWSVAMGANTIASGENSIAMGYGIASGELSTAMGSGTASGNGSTAMGYGTNTYNHESALACGKYNKDVSDMLFVIGNGRDDTHRSNILEVLSTGKVRVYGILTQSSDRRLKKDITPLSSASGILAKLRPVTYHWNKATAGSNSDEDLHYGFIAQEVEQVLPDLVSEDKDQGNKNDTHYKSINYIGLIPVLTKALQEKSAEIEALKAQLQSQEARLKALESKLK